MLPRVFLLEAEEHPSLALTSFPPAACGQERVRASSQLGRRKTAPAEEVSSSYSILAFRDSSMLAAAIWKHLQNAVPHSLNFHHEKLVTPSAHAVAPYISCLLAQ